jgi:hypothetical protein
MSACLEAREAPRLRLVAVHRKRLVVTPAGMGDMIDADAKPLPLEASKMSKTSGAWIGTVGSIAIWRTRPGVTRIRELAAAVNIPLNADFEAGLPPAKEIEAALMRAG